MRPNFYRSRTGVAACGAGWVAESAGRGHAEAPESVTLWGAEVSILACSRMSSRHRSGDDVGVESVGTGQDLGGDDRGRETEKLET